jgi:hypothetical protein
MKLLFQVLSCACWRCFLLVAHWGRFRQGLTCRVDAGERRSNYFGFLHGDIAVPPAPTFGTVIKGSAEELGESFFGRTFDDFQKAGKVELVFGL